MGNTARLASDIPQQEAPENCEMFFGCATVLSRCYRAIVTEAQCGSGGPGFRHSPSKAAQKRPMASQATDKKNPALLIARPVKSTQQQLGSVDRAADGCAALVDR
jgi:hypothetical protein